MEITKESPLYDAAMSALAMAEARIEESTRKDYVSSLRRFAEFCSGAGYPDPREVRYSELPSVMAAYIHRISETNTSQWPAEKLRAAVSWHYSSPRMLAGGHPHDQWVVSEQLDGSFIVRGNPAKSQMIGSIMIGLSKSKKRSRTPTRASPMSLPILTKMLSFLTSDCVFNESMRLSFAAVTSLCFYGMCRINEVLELKFGDIMLGMERPCKDNAFCVIRFGCFTLRDRKTDNDPHARRTYNLHYLPTDEWALEAITHVSQWFDHATKKLQHKWTPDEYAFPSLTRVPRAVSNKKKKTKPDTLDKSLDKAEQESTAKAFSKVGIKWGTSMTDNNFIQVLNIVAAASEVNRSIMGDEIWFTTHCFRRGGAQYRFMFAPDAMRWSLKMVKWWGGWSRNEQSETLVRYLLDDVLDREEHQLGDALAPDMIGKLKDSIDPPATTQSSTTTPLLSLEQLKTIVADSVREAVASMLTSAKNVTNGDEGAKNIPDLQASTLHDTAVQLSEFPEARSWRDYVTQYWTSDPARHQFRAGVHMLSHEKKIYKSRLSKMRLIAEHIRDRFIDDMDAFEAAMVQEISGDLTINKLCTYIRSQR